MPSAGRALIIRTNISLLIFSFKVFAVLSKVLTTPLVAFLTNLLGLLLAKFFNILSTSVRFSSLDNPAYFVSLAFCFLYSSKDIPAFSAALTIEGTVIGIESAAHTSFTSLVKLPSGST